jgi:hypothetical protein
VPEQRPVLQAELDGEVLDSLRLARERPVRRRRAAAAREVDEQRSEARVGERRRPRQEYRAVEPGARMEQDHGRAFAEIADV